MRKPTLASRNDLNTVSGLTLPLTMPWTDLNFEDAQAFLEIDERSVCRDR